MAESLGELLKRRMNDVGIRSNSELAKLIKKSSSYVGDLINDTGKTKSGKYIPSPETLALLAKVLKISEIEILNAVGYTSHNKEVDSFEIAPGATIHFEKNADWTPEEIDKIVEMTQVFASGIKTGNRSFTINTNRIDMKKKYGDEVMTEEDLHRIQKEKSKKPK